jgi:acyl-CoA thioester hydrolase
MERDLGVDRRALESFRKFRLTRRRGNAFSFPVAGVKALSQSLADALLVRVYYEDTDFSGRVYHASYLRFLERGRTEWLRARGFAHRELAETSGVAFAVRSLQIDYLAAAMMDDLLLVETWLAAARGASIEFRQRILRGDKELITAAVLAAAIRDGRPARLPASLRRLLRAPS